MSAIPRQMPLFPLNTVLFPGGTLPLHIFEERYRAMTRACLAGDERFGVVLIAEGDEVGAPAVPHRVGTIARIVMAEPLADGGFHLMVVGERRVAIEEYWLGSAGYLVGRVTPRPEVMDEELTRLAALVAAVRETVDEYLTRLMPEPDSARAELERLTDPIQLAGLTASLLQRGNQAKQRIIENDSVPGRLRQLHGLLQRELHVLDMLARPTQAGLKREVISPN